MAKKKVVDDPATPDIDESKVETGHDLNILQPESAAKIHQIISIANATLPVNKTINLTEALISIIMAAMAAYESHVGMPYDPDNLPDEPPIQ